MSNWHKLDIDQLNAPRTVRLGKQTFRAMPSPYDLPQAIRASRSDDQRSVIIEFSYLDEEPGEVVKTEYPWLALKLGKHSGRILQLIVEPTHVHVGEQGRRDLLHELSRAVEQAGQPQGRPAPARKANHDITNAVIANHYAELLEDLRN